MKTLFIAYIIGFVIGGMVIPIMSMLLMHVPILKYITGGLLAILGGLAVQKLFKGQVLDYSESEDEQD